MELWSKGIFFNFEIVKCVCEKVSVMFFFLYYDYYSFFWSCTNFSEFVKRGVDVNKVCPETVGCYRPRFLFFNDILVGNCAKKTCDVCIYCYVKAQVKFVCVHSVLLCSIGDI